MEALAYYDGKIGTPEELMVPFNDRVHFFGDGVYDAGPCRNYHIFAIDEHIDRFFNSAALLDIVMPVNKQELRDLLNKLVQQVDTGKEIGAVHVVAADQGIHGDLGQRQEVLRHGLLAVVICRTE